ncbi:lysozyme [Actinokineospora auranticolor]|uniref:Lysozyme n=1 Tax=Actinokineospora auranticolor TaxID=155976 RepID=A0A2S6GRK1_9PSEU|nr:lysozyme [Actinokineospora auranticolor]PPK67826.1 lysozyme [Actinokineospora auranticolor]
MATVHHRRPVLAAVLGAVVATVLATTPAAAGSTAPQVTNHEMGSQIRLREGVSRGAARATGATVSGIDVSSHQGEVDWSSWWNQGKRFAYVKATEGTSYRNPFFAQQYNGSYRVGMIRGAYHFALPDVAGGAVQAKFFTTSGGAWSRDGKTLPGVVDLEYNPYGEPCYGLSQAAMGTWIRDFTTTYKSRTGRDAVIYTSTTWWARCVGARSFSGTNPLWVARYASAVGTLPYDWAVWTFWQYTSSPIDQDYFNGTIDRLRVLATG